MIVRMCCQDPKNRATCKEIYEFIDNSPFFDQARNRQAELTAQIKISQYGYKVVEASSTFLIPFSVETEKEENYMNTIKQVQKNNELTR